MRPLSPSAIVMGARADGATLTQWLCDELRRAILDGRLRRGTRLPSTREFARVYRVSRRTAVTVFEQLCAEGYLTSMHGSGTVVNEQLPDDLLQVAPGASVSGGVTAARDVSPLYQRPARPFRPIEPALSEFPIDVWARIASRRMRRLSTSVLAGGAIAGYKPLRETVADYLATSRGVKCSADNVVIVSGAQQALDVLARLIIRRSDAVWFEDPGYTGAVDAFRRSGARVIAVKVDEHGFDPERARMLAPRARAAYVTPAHQFVLGCTMPLNRRLELLALARETKAYVIEDDYDSEFRFEGLPVPALQGLDRTGSVIYIGSFNKVLFPSLRLGYIVLPHALIDALLLLRYQTDRYPPGMSQAILCDFIGEGHFGRHLRRMRELDASRLDALRTNVHRYLAGAVEMPRIEAGLNTPVHLRNGMSSKHASARALEAGIESMPLDQFALRRRDLRGLLLGFAAFNESEIRQGVIRLAGALA